MFFVRKIYNLLDLFQNKSEKLIAHRYKSMFQVVCAMQPAAVPVIESLVSRNAE